MKSRTVEKVTVSAWVIHIFLHGRYYRTLPEAMTSCDATALVEAHNLLACVSGLSAQSEEIVVAATFPNTDSPPKIPA